MGYAKPFEIRLKKDSLFDESMNTGLKYILSIDVDRLLAPCFEMHNITPPNRAIRYGGWERKNASNWGESPESFTLAGHSLGHFLSAVAEFYNDHRNELVYNKLNYAVNQLDKLQELSGSSYIGGCPEDTFIKAFNGEDKWDEGYWVPWYGIHKIYQGLINVYRYSGNETALKVVTKFADWAVEGLSKLSNEQLQKMLEVEYGGMNEVFADMYELTKDKKYLEVARGFTQDSLINPLSKGEDVLSKIHANTQIPKVVGAAALYDQDRERFAYCRAASEFFWENVVVRRSYVIGGNSFGEFFETIKDESLGKKTCESCNTYNMLRLTERLFTWQQECKYMDYYEDALYNHILSQQEPVTGAKQYFVSLLQGHHRVYEIKEDSWWCCTGTGMENPGKYKRCIFYKNKINDKDEELYVNLYMPVEYTWKEKGITLKVETNYPFEEKVKIVVEGDGEATIKLRAPGWIKSKMNSESVDKRPMKVVVSGEAFTSEGGEYISLSRSWKSGDVIDIDIPLSVRTYKSRQIGKIAFKYGPFALGAKIADITDSDDAIEYISNETVIDEVTVPVQKLIYNKALFADVPKKVDGDELLFEIDGRHLSEGKTVYLQPFYSIHHCFHNVYWDVM